MVRTCMAFGCRGNYPHEPYTKLVIVDIISMKNWMSQESVVVNIFESYCHALEALFPKTQALVEH